MFCFECTKPKIRLPVPHRTACCCCCNIHPLERSLILVRSLWTHYWCSTFHKQTANECRIVETSQIIWEKSSNSRKYSRSDVIPMVEPYDGCNSSRGKSICLVLRMKFHHEILYAVFIIICIRGTVAFRAILILVQVGLNWLCSCSLTYIIPSLK